MSCIMSIEAQNPVFFAWTFDETSNWGCTCYRGFTEIDSKIRKISSGLFIDTIVSKIAPGLPFEEG